VDTLIGSYDYRNTVTLADDLSPNASAHVFDETHPAFCRTCHTCLTAGFGPNRLSYLSCEIKEDPPWTTARIPRPAPIAPLASSCTCSTLDACVRASPNFAQNRDGCARCETTEVVRIPECFEEQLSLHAIADVPCRTLSSKGQLLFDMGRLCGSGVVPSRRGTGSNSLQHQSAGQAPPTWGLTSCNDHAFSDTQPHGEPSTLALYLNMTSLRLPQAT
jgi:hypothetical protein